MCPLTVIELELKTLLKFDTLTLATTGVIIANIIYMVVFTTQFRLRDLTSTVAGASIIAGTLATYFIIAFLTLRSKKLSRIAARNLSPIVIEPVVEQVVVEKKTESVPLKAVVLESEPNVVEKKVTQEPKPVKQSPQSKKINEKTPMITCSACKKQFTTPLYTLDYSMKRPRLVGQCPYCSAIMETTQQKIDEVEMDDYFKKQH